MNLAALDATLTSIDPVDAREADSIARVRALVASGAELFDPSVSDHHLTASAFVISTRGVLLHRHRRMGIWVQPGGHVDAGEPIDEACVREVHEETGLEARHLEPPQLFHVDVHPGPKGHTHYDLRYVLVAPPEDPRPPPGESPEVFWFDRSGALERAEPGLQAALERLFGSIDELLLPD